MYTSTYVFAKNIHDPLNGESAKDIFVISAQKGATQAIFDVHSDTLPPA